MRLLLFNKQNAINYMYLLVSSLSTYCIINNVYLEFVCYIIGLLCLIDYFLYFCKINKLNINMIIHHLLTLLIIQFIYINSEKINNSVIKNELFLLIKNVLCVEISTNFLILRNLLKNSWEIIKTINDILFVITFVYFRLYHYTYYIILSKNTYYIILEINKDYFVFIGLYGLFLLNIYWFIFIINKMFHPIKK